MQIHAGLTPSRKGAKDLLLRHLIFQSIYHARNTILDLLLTKRHVNELSGDFILVHAICFATLRLGVSHQGQHYEIGKLFCVDSLLCRCPQECRDERMRIGRRGAGLGHIERADEERMAWQLDDADFAFRVRSHDP
jgi:hypothetical protein